METETVLTEIQNCATGNIEDRSDRIHRGQLREKESGVRV
jgi:hypothetical protein